MSATAPARLGWEEIEELRHDRGRSTLLFVTDRCPVGCAHCSVDSRRDSPTITDFELYGEILDWLCGQPRLEVVGISGGEPFVERRGLELAVRRLADAGKRVVIYTSGVWGTRARPPAWIREVLDRTSTVFLSTDAFHQEGVPDSTYVNAARAIAAADAWIVVQVIDTAPMVERAQELLRAAFGEEYEDFAELRLTDAADRGRGADVFTRTGRTPGHAFAACTMLASPIVRYDGLATACCNESVIMGFGPARLRRRAGSRAGVAEAMDAFHTDPMLRAIGGAGPGALTAHPRFADLAGRDFTSICDLCWTMLDRVADDERPDPLVDAINDVLVLTLNDTASDRLRAKLDFAYPALRASSERIWSSPFVRELYPVYLSTMHGIVRTPVALMEAALERARDACTRRRRGGRSRAVPRASRPGGEGARQVAARGPRGARRRPGRAAAPHPVRARRGVRRRSVLLAAPPPSGRAARAHGRDQRATRRRSASAERLRELTGYPPEAFRAIRRHERLDIRHRRELYEAIDSLPLRREHETLIGISAFHTVRAAIDVFDEILAAVIEPAAVEVTR